MYHQTSKKSEAMKTIIITAASCLLIFGCNQIAFSVAAFRPTVCIVGGPQIYSHQTILHNNFRTSTSNSIRNSNACCNNKCQLGYSHHKSILRSNWIPSRRTSSSCLFTTDSSIQNEDVSDPKDENGASTSTRKDSDDEHDWTSQTLAIALPALAGMMTDPLLSMVDTLFVGRLGYDAVQQAAALVAHGKSSASSSSSSSSTSSIPLAALGACTSIFHLCFHCFRATTLSTSSLVAGALVRDEEEMQQEITQQQQQQILQPTSKDNEVNNRQSSSKAKQDNVEEVNNQKEAVLIAQTSIQQSIITGILISTFLLSCGSRCLLAMGVPAGGELYQSAMTYLNFRSLAAPAVVMLSASEGIFRGYGDVITPWKVSVAVALLNLVLDPFCMFSGGGDGDGNKGWIMIKGLGMGIKGAAIATAFSQVCGAFLYGRYLFRKGLLGRSTSTSSGQSTQQRLVLKQQKRSIALTILRANAAMMAKQGSLLLGWAYATSRATRMGHTVVASHQMALSIWLVVALVLEGAGVAAQVLMAREWEGLKVLEKKKATTPAVNDDKASTISKEEIASKLPSLDAKRRTIKSLSLYMIRLSVIQGLFGSLAILLLRQTAPSFILTHDPAVRQNLLTLLPHIAGQMALVSVTLIAEALAIGGGWFKWLAAGTTVSSILAMVKLRGAKDLVGIWNGGIVALFLGRLATALLAVLDMNGCFRWRDKADRA